MTPEQLIERIDDGEYVIGQQQWLLAMAREAVKARRRADDTHATEADMIEHLEAIEYSDRLLREIWGAA